MPQSRTAACRVAVLLSLAPAAAGHAQRAARPFATLEPGSAGPKWHRRYQASQDSVPQ